MSWLWDGLAGAATGLLSGWGIGGGTLLMLYMVLIRGIPQQAAQGINLLYFLPCAGGALWGHIRDRRVAWRAAGFSLLGGLVTSAVFAFLAQHVEGAWLRRLFGVLLLLVGGLEVFHKKPKAS